MLGLFDLAKFCKERLSQKVRCGVSLLHVLIGCIDVQLICEYVCLVMSYYQSAFRATRACFLARLGYRHAGWMKLVLYMHVSVFVCLYCLHI